MQPERYTNTPDTISTKKKNPWCSYCIRNNHMYVCSLSNLWFTIPKTFNMVNIWLCNSRQIRNFHYHRNSTYTHTHARTNSSWSGTLASNEHKNLNGYVNVRTTQDPFKYWHHGKPIQTELLPSFLEFSVFSLIFLIKKYDATVFCQISRMSEVLCVQWAHVIFFVRRKKEIISSPAAS